MATPTSKGQYRYVEYTDDGCSIYQCLWCLNTIEIRDDPHFWNFCPKCGRSWFNKLECRGHNTPRWYYDRWGERADYNVMVMTFGGEVWANDLPYHWDKEPALEWYFEVRSTTFDSWPDHAVVEWGEWGFEYKSPYSFHHGYKYAKSMLSQFRLGHENPICDNWKWEYRATLRKIT